MQLHLLRAWSFLKDFSNLDLNSEFQNIRNLWNDHDSGIRTWNTVNAVNVTSSSFSPGGFNGTGAVLSTQTPRIIFGNAVPSAGAWVVGDTILNLVPSVGAPKSWVCTVAGTPGTWVSTGNL